MATNDMLPTPPKPRKLTPLLSHHRKTSEILPLNDNNTTNSVALRKTNSYKKRGNSVNVCTNQNSLDINLSNKINPTANNDDCTNVNDGEIKKQYDCIWDTNSLFFTKPPQPPKSTSSLLLFSSSSFNNKSKQKSNFDFGGGGSESHGRSSLGGRVSKNDNKEVEFQNLFKILHLNSSDILNSYVYNNRRSRSDLNESAGKSSGSGLCRQKSFHKIKLQKSNSFMVNPTTSTPSASSQSKTKTAEITPTTPALSIKRVNSFTSF
jgi:hypothetical protein